MKIKFTPEEWQNILGVEVIDPDGWDRRIEHFEKDWETPLTLGEFISKCDESTMDRFYGKFSATPGMLQGLAQIYIQNRVKNLI